MEYETLEIERDGAVLTVAMNRPERMNAMNRAMCDDLFNVFTRHMDDRTLRCVVVTGRGRGFCAGGDMNEFLASVDADPRAYMSEVVRKSHEVVLLVRKLHVPVIAAVNGPATGSGCNFALAADIKIAARSARFSERFVMNGLAPDTGGTLTLPRTLGLARASEMLLGGELIDAEQAWQWGLVNRVVDDKELESETARWVERFCNAATVAVSHAKRLINQSLLPELAQQMEAEREAIVATTNTHDFSEGVRAFLEKRAANFTGT